MCFDFISIFGTRCFDLSSPPILKVFPFFKFLFNSHENDNRLPVFITPKHFQLNVVVVLDCVSLDILEVLFCFGIQKQKTFCFANFETLERPTKFFKNPGPLDTC